MNENQLGIGGAWRSFLVLLAIIAVIRYFA
jgi:hypothetical protein